MRRREPPPIATWVLEHMTPEIAMMRLLGTCSKPFKTAAQMVGTAGRQSQLAPSPGLRASVRRTPLLVFVLLWSMAAPAWNTFCLIVESDSVQNRFCSIFGPIWILPALVAWTVLHSIFLWGGLLIFGTFHRTVGLSLSQ